MPRTTADRARQRDRLVTTACERLESDGPEALRARELTAAVGTSTQAVYTLFGGMPGLVDAVVAEGFARASAYIDAVAEGDDPVADHVARGWAYVDWALAHPQLYRLMFGVSGYAGLDTTVDGHNPPESRDALAVLVRSVERMIHAGRIHAADPLEVARQFLAATHGYVLLEIAGSFGPTGSGLATMAGLGVHLLVGLGDDRAAAEASISEAVARRATI